MQLGTPQRLEYAILKASDVIGNEIEEPEPEQDFRDDSPFASDSGTTADDSIEHSVYWLHEQGYTFSEIYKLLIGEIEVLSKGFEEEQKKRENQQQNTGQSTSAMHGNKGDRASQLGWR